jgi:CheY-like chemotaxis protein/thioredoxin-like negative regulator of GroEL
MTGLRRTLGFAIALAAFSAPTRAWPADEMSDTFKQGVELLERGHKEEALKAFQKVLAMSPNEEAAYALWKDNDYRVWRDLLVEGGQFELAAKRLIQLARVGRKAHQNDAPAIQALVAEILSSPDALARLKAVRSLSSQHGEYAVPYLLPLLSGDSDEEKRVSAMHTLAQMDTDVVIPLIEALGVPQAAQRRNVALVLGLIGDPRAAGALLWVASHDSDESVRAAARESAARMSAGGDPLALFLKAGDDYHNLRDSVLRDQDWSDVVWSLQDGQLIATPVPRYLYNDEMAKRAYDNALRANPNSTEALAGLARAYVDEETKIERMEKAGKDVGEWKTRAEESLMAVNAAGVDALDLALRWSVRSGDSSTSGALCRVLGPLCKAPCDALAMALASNDGATRAEAAVALGMIAARNGQVADPRVIAALGEAAGREIMRVALVIDGDAARAKDTAAKLEKAGVLVNIWNSGTKGLAMLHRAPGLDLVVVAETLPDLTTEQVLDEIKSDDRLSAVPILVVAKNGEEAATRFGDRIAGVIAGGDMQAVEAVLSKELSGDRALADNLSMRAADVLARLSRVEPSALAPIVPALMGTLATRPDGVIIPALRALGAAAGAPQTAGIIAVLADEKHSDDARVAAAQALGGILARDPNAVSPEGLAELQAVVSSKASIAVRNAAAHTLGLMRLEPAARAELMHRLRSGESMPAADKK